ncbi:MAG: DUF3035 domain-containing protein [Bdellovibrionales bacterium]
MSRSRSYVLLGIAMLLLAACGELRQDLGLGRNPPDEFAVVDRPPLSMPPDYGLRPPRPGAARPQVVDTDQQAKTALFGETAPQGKELSATEKALLENSGASKADPNIREIVDRESTQKAVASPHLVRRLLDWSGDNGTGTVVDAKAEADRIKKAKENNQSVTSGATPVIEKQKSGWLGL